MNKPIVMAIILSCLAGMALASSMIPMDKDHCTIIYDNKEVVTMTYNQALTIHKEGIDTMAKMSVSQKLYLLWQAHHNQGNIYTK